jgi:pantothenate synthetase
MRNMLLSEQGLLIDYAVAVDAATLRGDSDMLAERTALCIAVKLGATRLIDNMLVEISTA